MFQGGPSRLGSWPYQQKIDKTRKACQAARDKHYSLLDPGACIIKHNMAVIYSFRNKLECLSLGAFPALSSV